MILIFLCRDRSIHLQIPDVLAPCWLKIDWVQVEVGTRTRTSIRD